MPCRAGTSPRPITRTSNRRSWNRSATFPTECDCGEAYADWAGEPWAEAETARLTELRLLGQELALAAALGSGRPQEVVPAARAHVRSHPLREEGAAARRSAARATP
ncbi:BTAD domain-containing putative transcriptional regulator, partial [Kitasatospora sp. NPDC059973]|uniref:AfsR/SARP family transcriptional regulator n=1 Tax=Kitasatospora sp. NPDC059973 TaxID=3347020 RepID=UPI00367BA0C3